MDSDLQSLSVATYRATRTRVRRLVRGYMVLAAVIWSALLGGSLWWNVQRQRDIALELALATARSAFDKDVAYRAWASSHGGVYVTPTEKTPPSPWMAHLADRDLVTTEGRRLTLMNPAYMLREMMQDYGDLYGIKGRLVGIVYLNPNNEADPWEADAIRQFSAGTVREKLEVSAIDGAPYLRLIKPFFMEQSCQKCHGHLGFRNGEVRGAVGVSVPMKPYQEAERKAVVAMTASHGGFWLLGAGSIVLIGRRSRARLLERAIAEEENRLAAHVFRHAQEAMIITNAEGRILRVNPTFSEMTGYGADEVMGRTPRVLRSDHHDQTFYQAMWDEITSHGRWAGEIWNRRADGSVFIAWESITAVKDDGGQVHYYIGSFSDITERVEAQRHIVRLAHYDLLTELPNRALFQDRLERAVVHARRNSAMVALLFLDLDGFKKVNDTMGHRAGDDLLRQVADRLRHSVRMTDTIARLGGDEFTVILDELSEADDAMAVAEKILAEVGRPITIEGREVVIGCSVGASFFPEHGETGEELLKHADTAMYQAKGGGKGRVNVYSSEMSRLQERRLALELALRQAVDTGGIDVHFQPKADVKTNKVTGFEVLARWSPPEFGPVSPADFIPIAEEAGLVQAIDLLVLRRACQVGKRFMAAGHAVTMAANLSGSNFRDSALAGRLATVIDEEGFPPGQLELEVTETFVLDFGAHQRELLDSIGRMGIRLAIDDFGTGYSSLSYLKRLPVNTLKIDRAFVRDLSHDSRDKLLVASIIGMAHGLGLKVVAEGVEEPGQRDGLLAEDCDEYQGYLLSRPVPADEALAFLDRQSRTAAEGPGIWP